MYSKLREKTGKQFVKKYQYPFGPLWQETDSIYKSQVTGQLVGHETFGRKKETTEEMLARIEAESEAMEEANYQSELESLDTSVTAVEQTIAKGDEIAAKYDPSVQAAMKSQKRAERDANFRAGFGGAANGTIASAIGNFKDGNWKTGLVDTAVAGIKAVDNLAMGDKNFGAQSEAIDDAVHGVSGFLMKSGNPYAMAAGAALEGANFLTKAGGQTVEGFDVDINSSGYGQMGHMESSSSRDFGAMIGLGGIFGQKSLQRKLQKRNQQALMAMNAANIAEDQKFEQDARMNSIQNVIMNNQIALSGGLETNLLGG